jgi:hypothetical protein
VSKHRDPAAKVDEDVQGRQRNTTWPDVVRNAGSVDGLLWKGSPNPTKVQRVGIAIFGLFFLVLAVGTAIPAVERHSTVQGVVAVIAFLIGMKVILNAFFKRKMPRKDRHPHHIPPNS